MKSQHQWKESGCSYIVSSERTLLALDRGYLRAVQMVVSAMMESVRGEDIGALVYVRVSQPAVQPVLPLVGGS